MNKADLHKQDFTSNTKTFKTKKRILITGSVLALSASLKVTYNSLISLIEQKYSKDNSYLIEIYSPLDTMKFNGSDKEKYERAMTILKDSHVMIAEMSQISTGQGIEIQEAVHRTIPILVIAKNGSKISGLVKGCPMVKKVIYYETIDSIKEEIVRFLEEEL